MLFRSPHLRAFLRQRLSDKMPRLDFRPQGGRIPKGDLLRRTVRTLLQNTDAVIALTDVYTGGRPRDFADADDAKRKMRSWVGDEPRFHPHAAQHDFEAWLLPYWTEIAKIAGSNKTAPSPNPETVNHDRPPATVLAEIFRTGSAKRRYLKTRDALAILSDQDLTVSAEKCPELKAFLNTILTLSGGEPL